MNEEERFKLIQECLFYMFPDTLYKWTKAESISHLIEGSLKADIVFLEALTNRELIFEVVWREYDFNESCGEIRKRREARITGGKAKANKLKPITELIGFVLSNDPEGKAPELWDELVGALDRDNYSVEEYALEDGTKALRYWKGNKERLTFNYKAFKSALSRLKNLGEK